MTETPDTVTPLDAGGDEGDFEPFDESTGNITSEYYDTKGQTTVATRPGYRFAPSNKELPVVTAEGTKMTKEQAEEVVAESNGRVHFVDSEDEGEK